MNTFDAIATRRAVKAFDPDHLLNPGVILNDDAETHIKNLKPLPATHEIADKCIECGFCERVCPSVCVARSPMARGAVQRQRAAVEITASVSIEVTRWPTTITDRAE